jgi:tripartite-type tricarboxylate transporter receptor subunit TctC
MTIPIYNKETFMIRLTTVTRCAVLFGATAGLAQAQTFPDKPITMIVSYAAGATTDVSARALAAGAEKILGVPIAVDNKAGGGGTVAAGLLVSKKPDGYTIMVGSTGPLTIRPMLMKVSYDRANITGLLQYSYFHNGSVVVRGDSPWKTINDFVAYAKANPGMAYGTAGAGGVATGSQQLGVEALKKCKGLEFKHVPTKGGSEANTMLMGKHLEFTSGSGSHLPLVANGVFRELVIFQRTRDENFPNVPTLKDIGCDWDYPPNAGIIISVPKGVPPAVFQKLEDAFTKVAQSDDFKALLKRNYLPYDFRDSKALAGEIRSEVEWYTDYFKKTGVLKTN